MQDITAEHAPDLSRISQDEHTAVIREIHHRVKNNLQVIVRLFNLEAARTTNREVINVVEAMQNRVRAIANLHERRYSTEDFSAIHFGAYLQALVRDLEGFYDAGPRLKVQLSVTDLALDIKEAAPVALISNELVSNSFRHAFPENRSGHVSVKLQYTGVSQRMGSKASNW